MLMVPDNQPWSTGHCRLARVTWSASRSDRLTPSNGCRLYMLYTGTHSESERERERKREREKKRDEKRRDEKRRDEKR